MKELQSRMPHSLWLLQLIRSPTVYGQSLLLSCCGTTCLCTVLSHPSERGASQHATVWGGIDQSLYSKRLMEN